MEGIVQSGIKVCTKEPRTHFACSQSENFCGNCGAGLMPLRDCEKCGNQIYPTTNFCRVCGERNTAYDVL